MNPGEKTLLTITYNTFKFPGAFAKTVTVTTVEPEKRDFVISLRGVVEEAPMGKIEVAPRKADLGKLQVGEIARQTYTIRNVGTAPLRVQHIYSKKSRAVLFDEKENGPLVISPGKDYSFHLEVLAEEPGQLIDLIFIRCDARNSSEKGYKVVAVAEVEERL